MVLGLPPGAYAVFHPRLQVVRAEKLPDGIPRPKDATETHRDAQSDQPTDPQGSM